MRRRTCVMRRGGVVLGLGWLVAAGGACGGSSTGAGGGDTGGSGGIDITTTGGTTAVGTSTTEAGTGGATSAATGSSGSVGSSGGDSGTGGGSSSGGGSTGGSTTDGDTTGGLIPEGSSSTMDCPSAEVQFEPVIPTVILLIDQSGSMTADFNGEDRWDVVRDALIDPVTGVVANLENDVRFGLALFTSNGGDAGGECPVLAEEAPMIGNLMSISETYQGESPTGDTPTGDSIDAVVASLLAKEDEGPRIIVLATDGEPDTCEVPNPQQGQEEAIVAAENAFANDIQTFIISVGNDVSETHLQAMANAGVGVLEGDPDAPFYVPTDEDAMIAAFEEIINGVRSCVLTLDTAILPGQADQGTVTINGVVIPFDDPNGWQVNSPTEIELLGTSCEAIQEGDVEVTVEFTCEAIIPG
ncbi:MAG: vWA domain-containing protein [Myxococcota bacterium]